MDEILAPYDESLSEKSWRERSGWAAGVCTKLKWFVPDLDHHEVIVLAEELYADLLRGLIPNAKFPLANLDEAEQELYLL